MSWTSPSGPAAGPTSGDDSFIGSGADDAANALGGNDSLAGGEGNDTLAGGAGADTLGGGDGFDLLSYAGSADAVVVDLASGTASGGDATGDVISGFENVEGGAGNDTLRGDDTLGNMLSGHEGDDSLEGGGGRDQLSGGNGADTILGGLDDDVIEGGAGADSLVGGDGFDMVSYAGAAIGVTVDLATQTTSGGHAEGDTIDGFEDAEGGAGDDTLRGSADGNYLYGNGGNDSIEADAADDIVYGGTGNDTLLGQGGDDTIEDYEGDNSISGGAGSDFLAGGDGADTLDGGDDNDQLYEFGTLGGVMLGGNGDDEAIAGAGDDLLDGGNGNDSLSGGIGNNTLLGGDGDDVIEAGADADSLDGGAGLDLISYIFSADAVVVDLAAQTASGGDATGDVMVGFEDAEGGSGDDTLIGDAGENILYGRQGADLLAGGDGDDSLDGEFDADTLEGGNGNDVLDDPTGANLLDGGDGDDTIAGSDDADTILGGDGNDLVGWIEGADSIDGGAGIDAVEFGHLAPGEGIFVADTGVVGFETGAGIGASWTSIEQVFGGNGNDTIDFASGGDLTLDGRGGDDDIAGHTGADLVSGGVGNDFAQGNNGADTITGDAGDDTVLGGEGDDRIDGGTGADQLEGGEGADTILSGNTNDVVLGGNGADLLVVSGGNNTALGGDGNDLIRILGTPGNGDSLDGGLDADTLQSGAGFYSLSRAGDVYTMEYLGADSAGGVISTSSFEGFEAFFTRTGPFDLSTIGDGSSALVAVCFAAGTRIMTPGGEVAIEALRPGDDVLTADGGVEPLLFLGRRHVTLAGRADAAEMAPIRIRAGALGNGLPRRDLVVSPDHCLFLDGALVPARLLVDGTTITRETQRAAVTWFHLELPRHAVVLAEGAAAESWLDCGNRSWFANAPVALLRAEGNLDAAGTGWDTTRACAPLVHGGQRLAAIRAAIAAAEPISRDPGRRRPAGSR